MRTRLVVLVTVVLLLAPVASVAAPVASVSPGVSAEVPVGVWPLRPHHLVAGFDPPSDPWGAGHRGVDLLGRSGEPVHAAMGGRISFVGRVAGRGVVVVDHGDTRTTYEPVGQAPPRGTAVAAGDRIGRLEAVGSHCWPEVCLHWGWIRGDTYLDPLLLVGAAPVRLLPLSGLPLVGPGAAPAPFARAPVPWRPGAGVGGSCWASSRAGGQARGWACW